MFNDTPARKQIGYWVSEYGRSQVKQVKIKSYTDLESPVEFLDGVGELNPLPPADKGTQLWTVVQANVVAHKVPVQTVSPPLLLVEEDVRG